MSNLKDICNYYLDCIGSEGINISVFADSHKGLDYIQMENFPEESPDFENLSVSTFFTKRKGANFYIGYPTYAKELTTKNGQKFFKLEPILLFKINIDANNYSVDLGNPTFNIDAIKSLCGSSGNQVVNDIAALEDALGFYEQDTVVDTETLLEKLKKLTENWDWRKAEADEFSFVSNETSGIFCKAIIVAAQSNPYTQGLVQELKNLSKMNFDEICNSALQQLLNPKDTAKHESGNPVLEVLPLNQEQKRAVNSALYNQVTIITGPPGTGKSQVIANILINAVLQNKKVLFASKNNKAVDVVEKRVNEIGERPILLRQGSNIYQQNLAKYLLSLVQLNGTTEDLSEYEELKVEYSQLINKIEQTKKLSIETIKLRNKTDELEQNFEEFRKNNGAEFTRTIKEIDVLYFNKLLKHYEIVLKNVDKNKFTFFDKIVWLFDKNGRIKKFENILSEVYANLQSLNIKNVKQQPKYDIFYLDDYYDLLEKLKIQLDGISEFQIYLKTLEKLKQAPRLEDIDKAILNYQQALPKLSKRIWQLYLIKQSIQLTREDRLNISGFIPLLNTIINSDTNGTLAKVQYGQYNNLAQKCAHLLPCWAVTSLSAKSGKIPFIKNYYDIVIFDEASQCDIASALPLLYRAKSMVVIGDPKQLSHITTLKPSDELNYRRKNNLSAQDTRFSYIGNSLYDISQGLIQSNEDIVQLLKEHYRSHSDIIGFSNEYFYGNKLRIATKFNDLKLMPNGEKTLSWIDIQGEVIRPRDGGACNEKEAVAVINELKQILLIDKYKGTIGVVTPFRAQANKIREYINSDENLLSKINSADLLVNTAHGFQGDERDIMIFSPVVSKNIHSGAILFLSKEGNVFNVAITRARAHLIVVGDKTACLTSNIEYLSKFSQYANSLDSQIQTHSYPSVANISFVSEWEKLFYEELCKNGIFAIPQYQTCGYSLDFAIINGERKLNIEIDGKYYHKKWNGEINDIDRIRNQRLYEDDWDVMRFWVYEVRDDMDDCINKVKDWINQCYIAKTYVNK